MWLLVALLVMASPWLVFFTVCLVCAFRSRRGRVDARRQRKIDALARP